MAEARWPGPMVRTGEIASGAATTGAATSGATTTGATTATPDTSGSMTAATRVGSTDREPGGGASTGIAGATGAAVAAAATGASSGATAIGLSAYVVTSGLRSSGCGAAMGSVAGASVVAPFLAAPPSPTLDARRGGGTDGEPRGAEGAIDGALRGPFAAIGDPGAPEGSGIGALGGASLIRIVIGAAACSGSWALSIVLSPSAFTISGGSATAVSAFSCPLAASRFVASVLAPSKACGVFAAGATPIIVRRMARAAVSGRGMRDGLSLFVPCPCDPTARRTEDIASRRACRADDRLGPALGHRRSSQWRRDPRAGRV